MKSILRYPMKTELCCPAQCNASTGVYEHRGDHGPPQRSCWVNRSISPFSALKMHIPTMVHLGQPQNLLPKSWMRGDKTHCCWTLTSFHVAQLHKVAGKHAADPLHQHHPCITQNWIALPETSAILIPPKREFGAWPKPRRLEVGLLGDQDSSGKDMVEV